MLLCELIKLPNNLLDLLSEFAQKIIKSEEQEDKRGKKIESNKSQLWMLLMQVVHQLLTFKTLSMFISAAFEG